MHITNNVICCPVKIWLTTKMTQIVWFMQNNHSVLRHYSSCCSQFHLGTQIVSQTFAAVVYTVVSVCFYTFFWCNHHCTLPPTWVTFMILSCCSMRFFKNIFDGLLSSCPNSCVMSENFIFYCSTWRYHGPWYIVTWSDSDTLRIGGRRVCVQSEYTV